MCSTQLCWPVAHIDTCITVLFCLPVFHPWDTWETFNFTGPIIVGLFIIVAIWWAVSARKWFLGPQVQGTPEELRAIEIALETGDVETFRKLEDEEDERVTEHQHGH